MFHLPHELQCIIFEYDNTYHNIYKEVLKSRYEIYKEEDKNFFIIFDYFSENSYITNSLEKPTYLTTTHTYLKRKKKHEKKEYYLETFKDNMLKKHNLKKINKLLKFDLNNVNFCS
jgi:hypothetical protein